MSINPVASVCHFFVLLIICGTISQKVSTSIQDSSQAKAEKNIDYNLPKAQMLKIFAFFKISSKVF